MSLSNTSEKGPSWKEVLKRKKEQGGESLASLSLSPSESNLDKETEAKETFSSLYSQLLATEPETRLCWQLLSAASNPIRFI